MYLNVNILLIILLYQCLTICPFQIGMSNDQSNILSSISGENDCSLWAPNQDALKMPIAYVSNSNMYSKITPDHNGRLKIKHNTSFTFLCQTGKFLSAALNNATEVNVRCLRGNNIEYRGQTYLYKDFECKKDKKKSVTPYYKFTVEYLTSKNRKDINDCLLWIPHEDYDMPIPMTDSEKPKILYPDVTGNLIMKHKTVFRLSCTDRKFIFPAGKNTNEIKVQCDTKTNVLYDGRTYDFNQFKCSKIPQSRAMATQQPCQGANNSIVNVGFPTQYSFLTLYKICFNKVYKNALYAWNVVQSPHPKRRQVSRERTDFYKSHLFEGVDVDLLYKTQIATVGTILQSKELAYKYIETSQKNGEHFLSRGHLMSRNIFNYAFEQGSTFYFENTAPQWQIFNEGVWRDVEKTFKRCLSRGNSKHVIVTGTYGSCMLPDVNNVNQPLSLRLPKGVDVPLFIWKMDYDVDKGTGVVFIGLNHPYKKLSDSSNYICDRTDCPYKVIKTKRYSEAVLYCCTKESFEKVYGQIDPIVFQPF